jgi:membrane-associated phospholipid phosphatase
MYMVSIEHLLVKLLADWLMLPIIGLAFYALIWRVPSSDRYDRYTRIFMSGITSYMLAKFVANLWQPEQLRPFEQLGVRPDAAYLNNPGFPSDHALFGFFLTLAVWYGSRNRTLTAVMAILTILMCIGRVIALVHTPLDIAGAGVVAAIGALWYISYAKKRLHTHLVKDTKK